MIKQASIYFILSLLSVVFASTISLIITEINWAINFLNLELKNILNDQIISGHHRMILLLLLIPIIAIKIPAAIWQFIKKKELSYQKEAIWFIWLLCVISQLMVK